MQELPPLDGPLKVIGRYAVYGQLAAGGMAAVHLGRLLGPAGFSRTVAIKRLHPQFAKDPEFVAMFLDEARLAARIQHPNVVATVDVVARDEELFLVMDYIRGESFSRLLRTSRKLNVPVRPKVIASIVAGMLHGLHAAHEAKDERGQALSIVHRDVSPQNVIVGVDGVPRVLDFGVAKAAARVQITRDGQMKGKLCYMSPEQLLGRGVDRRSDVFAAGIVLWEALTGRRLFESEDPTEILNLILRRDPPPPSTLANVPRVLDLICAQALSRNPETRYQTARDFAVDLEEAVSIASPREVGEWVEAVAGTMLSQREDMVAEIEIISAVTEATPDVDNLKPPPFDPRRPQIPRAPAVPALAAEWDNAPTSVLESDKIGARDATAVEVPRPSGRPSGPSRMPVPERPLATATEARPTTPPAPRDGAPAQDAPSVIIARESTPPRRRLAQTITARRAAGRFLESPMIVTRRPVAAGLRSDRVLLWGGAATAALVFGAVFSFARLQRGQVDAERPLAAPELRETPHAGALERPAAERAGAQAAAPHGIDPALLPPAEPATDEAAADLSEQAPSKRGSARPRISSPARTARTETTRVAVASEGMAVDEPRPPSPEAKPSVDLSNPYRPEASAPAPRPAATPAVTAAAASRSAGCAQPYVVDPSGIRRIKPECL